MDGFPSPRYDLNTVDKDTNRKVLWKAVGSGTPFRVDTISASSGGIETGRKVFHHRQNK